MKDKERLELTFNKETERDLWEYIESLGKKKATNVKSIIRERMYADKLNAPAAGKIEPQPIEVEPVAPEVEEVTPADEKENTESTFDASRSPLFKAKEI